jgi:glycosyltransferase involved in cell wall biosynthesis
MIQYGTMRILIIFNRYMYRGGEDTYIEILTSLLKKHGHTVLLYEKDSRNIKNIFDSFWAGIGLFWNVKVDKELTHILLNFKPHAAHFHNIYPLISPTAYRTCKKNNVPIIQTIHNYKFVCPKNSLFRNGSVCELCVKKSFFWPSILYGCYHNSLLSSFVYSCAFLFHKLIGTFKCIDTYIFPTKFVKDYYCKYNLYISKKNIAILPYPSPLLRATKISVKKYKPYVYIGRLSEEKGVISLVSLFVKNKRLLTLVGDGPLKEKVQEMAKSSRNIHFIPHSSSSDIKKIINGARAVIIPSLWYEVLPFALLEAMSLGKIIFLPNSRNLLTIENRNNIRYFNPYSLTDLEAKIKKFEKIKRATNIQPMPTIYSTSYHYSQLMQIYEKAL